MQFFWMKSKFLRFFLMVVTIVTLILFLNTKDWNESKDVFFVDYLRSSISHVNNKLFKIDGEIQEESSADKESRVSSSFILSPNICNKNLKTNNLINLNETYDVKVLRRHPNLPEFLICSPRLNELIPYLTKIRWSGTSYQESWEDHPKCYLYSANFDSRLPTGLIVRILASCETKIKLVNNSYCQFWYHETEAPVISHIYEAGFPGPNTGKILKTTMMGCKVPIQNGIAEKMPIAVSVVEKPCTSSFNILKIGGSPYKKEEGNQNDEKRNITIGLCSKGLFYYNEDYSIRLIEWIEILKILGISKFFLYKTPCHKNVEKVLDYYEKEGTAKVLSFHYGPPFVQEGTFIRLWTKSNLNEYRVGHNISYNDCILRNKDDYDYLAIFDYDELPILKKHKNLPELMKYLRETTSGTNVAAYSLEWKMFYSNLEPGSEAANISTVFHNLRHNRRMPFKITMHKENNVKSIYDTRKILYVGGHSSIGYKSVLPLSHEQMMLSHEIAYFGNFTETKCSTACAKNKMEQETALLKHKNSIVERIEFVLHELKFKY